MCRVEVSTNYQFLLIIPGISGAVWDSKEGLAVHIEKNYFKFWVKEQYVHILEIKAFKMTEYFFKFSIFLVRGPRVWDAWIIPTYEANYITTN